MLLSVNKTNQTISGIMGKQRYAVPFDQEVFNRLQDLEEAFEEANSIEEAEQIISNAQRLIAKEERPEVIKLRKVTSNIHLNEETGRFHLQQNGVISSQAIPKVLADKMVQMFQEELTIEPLIRAWVLFLRNPNFTPEKSELFGKYITTTSVDEDEYMELIEQGYDSIKARELATYNDVSITKNGLLLTNKYATLVNKGQVAEDAVMLPPVMGETGDRIMVNGVLTHNISVGKQHSLPGWEYVNCSDSQSCVKGLHLGGLTYIRSYGGGDNPLLDCFVSPDKIGAFDNSGNGAIRVLEYFVYGVNFARNKQLYHESNYAAKIEADWAIAREEAIANSEEIIARLKAAQAELRAL